MSEELIIELRYAIKYFELLAAVAGIIYLKKWRNDATRYLVLYLLVITAAEFLGNWFGRIEMYSAKNYLYKWFVLPFEFTFFTFFFYKIVKIQHQKFIFLMLVSVFICCFAFEKIFLDNVKLPMNSFSYSVSVIIILFFIFCYLKNLIRSSEILNFYKSSIFWIVTGLFIFYLISLPYYLLFNSLVKYYYKEIFLPYQLLVIILNYIMYTIFTANFIWTKAK